MAKIGFAALSILTPLLGVWIGSSLARAQGGPVWVPIFAGALCFPVLPLAWEAFGQWRRRKRGRAPILTFFDRLVLRTLLLNLAFVGGLVAWQPSIVFSALSKHGDWMLDGRDDAWAVQARERLHLAADNLAWLHELTHPNVYEELIDADALGDEDIDPKAGSDYQWQPVQEPTKPEDVFSTRAWPFEPELHPLVREIPIEEQDSPDEVGRYFAAHEPDPVQRLKAVHDYVADRVAYDVPALRSGRFPPQDAQTVLIQRKAVCAGYARLVKAIADAADLHVVVVVGKTRTSGDLGHAWNAAEIDGTWYLLDATWDAGSVDERFTKSFRTVYFMTPPNVFLNDHYPDDPKWQLREEPLSLGDFLRRPNLEPSFSVYGFAMDAPARPEVTVEGDRTFTVRVKNPNGFDANAVVYEGETWDGTSSRCSSGGKHETFTCPLVPGPNLVVLFGPDNRNMAQVLVTAK